MTERENLLMVYRGEIPEWLPRYSLAPAMPGSGRFPASAPVGPSVLGHKHVNGKDVDIWGVEYTPTESTGGMALPTPGKFILTDITKWRDVIKAPDLSGVDWERMAAEDLKYVNREESVVELMTHVGYFQHLMEFMGFSEGLTAMYEEPEEVIALFEYMADFYDDCYRKAAEYYKPDVLSIVDDTATANNPFFSLDMYRELVKPYHARLGKITLVGCWDSSGPPAWPGATEELVRSEVRRCIDTFAPNGNFVFWGSIYGPENDPDRLNKTRWLAEEYESYGRSWYKNH